MVPLVQAHYGGIDEIGIFVLPAVAVILVLRWAERRAKARGDTDNSSESGGSSPDSQASE